MYLDDKLRKVYLDNSQKLNVIFNINGVQFYIYYIIVFQP